MLEPRKILRKEILDFSPYSPGLSIEEIKEKYTLDSVIKLASNENPLGVSPRVSEVIKNNAGLSFRYPRSGNPSLLKEIAGQLQVPRENVVAGNGSDEIIDLLIRMVGAEDKNIAAFDPCFSMYALQAKMAGVEFRQCPLNKDYSFPWKSLRRIVDENTVLVFITNPDNPSGYAAKAVELEEFAKSLPEQCLLVVDEAYMDFAEDINAYSLLPRFQEFQNLIILRTFSKLFGLAGLRLGYGVMPEWLADYMLRVKLPFSVNLLAEKAGIAALKDKDFIQATRETVSRGIDFITRELDLMGFQVYPSQANFLLVKPPIKAQNVFQGLLERGIIIRHLDSYGMEDALRITVGKKEENEKLILEIQAILQEENTI